MIHQVAVPKWSDNRPFSKHNYMECAGLRCSWYYGKLAVAYNHRSSAWYIYDTRAYCTCIIFKQQKVKYFGCGLESVMYVWMQDLLGCRFVPRVNVHCVHSACRLRQFQVNSEYLKCFQKWNVYRNQPIPVSSVIEMQEKLAKKFLTVSIGIL